MSLTANALLHHVGTSDHNASTCSWCEVIHSAHCNLQAWDLATGRCEHTLISHRDKVQALAWHPTEASCLLSGGFDKQALVSDLRTPNGATAAWQCPEDVESLAWNPHQPATFVVSSEKGEVACYDTRKGAGAESVFTLAAHAKATTGMAFNPAAAGLLVTGSVDRTVRRCCSAAGMCSHKHFGVVNVVMSLSHWQL